jgi:hypothetical protein
MYAVRERAVPQRRDLDDFLRTVAMQHSRFDPASNN